MHDDTIRQEDDPREVCTLPGDALEERLDWIRREILPHALETARLDDGVAFELDGAPGMADKVELLIGLESACCPSLGFEAVESATPGRLRLEVRGIDPGWWLGRRRARDRLPSSCGCAPPRARSSAG